MHCPHFRLQLSTSSSRLAQRRTLLLTGILLALVVLLPHVSDFYSLCMTAMPSITIAPIFIPSNFCQSWSSRSIMSNPFPAVTFADALIICEWLRQASWWNVWESCAYLKLWAKRLVCSRSLKPTQTKFHSLLLFAHTLLSIIKKYILSIYLIPSRNYFILILAVSLSRIGWGEVVLFCVPAIF